MEGKTLALLSTSCTATSAICMAIGWYLIKKGKVDAHRRFMITSVILAALFFILYISRTVFIGNNLFGGPAEYKPYYTAFLFFHITLTIISPILAIKTLRHAYRKEFDKHRKWGPITARTWFVTAVTGVIVYLLLFVIFPEGPKTDPLTAVWGF